MASARCQVPRVPIEMTGVIKEEKPSVEYITDDLKRVDLFPDFDVKINAKEEPLDEINNYKSEIKSEVYLDVDCQVKEEPSLDSFPDEQTNVIEEQSKPELQVPEKPRPVLLIKSAHQPSPILRSILGQPPRMDPREIGAEKESKCAQRRQKKTPVSGRTGVKSGHEMNAHAGPERKAVSVLKKYLLNRLQTSLVTETQSAPVSTGKNDTFPQPLIDEETCLDGTYPVSLTPTETEEIKAMEPNCDKNSRPDDRRTKSMVIGNHRNRQPPVEYEVQDHKSLGKFVDDNRKGCMIVSNEKTISSQWGMPHASVNNGNKDIQTAIHNKTNNMGKKDPAAPRPKKDKLVKYYYKCLRHHPQELYKCLICGKMSKTWRPMEKHVRTHPIESVRSRVSKNNIVCLECGKSLREKHSLDKHMRLHTGEQPHSCKLCNARFTWRRALQAHMCKEHGAPMPYQCPHCNKRYATSGQLSSHIKMHSVARPFRCTVCNKSFKTQRHLDRHGLTHSDTKSFQCHVCGKFFSQSASLGLHLVIHGGDKYLCEVCGKLFTQKASLTSHLRSHDAEG